MKKYYCLVIFLFFIQCQSDNLFTKSSSTGQATIETIQADRDFIDFVNLTGQYVDLIYDNRGKLYDKRNIKNPFIKIEESQNKISNYLENGLTTDEVPLVLKEYNVSQDQVTDLVGRIIIRVGRLNQKFGENALQRLTKAELNMAFEHAKQTISINKSMARHPGPSYCVQCPYANCENCGPGQNPDEGGIFEFEGSSPGSYSDDKCARVRKAAAIKRENSKANAWNEYAAETIACAGSAIKSATELYGATWYLNALGPEAPFVVASLGSVGIGGGCLVLATRRLDSNLKIAESDYILDVMGQGCNP